MIDNFFYKYLVNLNTKLILFMQFDELGSFGSFTFD